MRIYEIRKSAREALAGKWGKAVCIVLAYVAFFFVIGFIIGLVGEETMMGTLLDLASSIIQVPIILGLTYVFIKLKRNEEVKAFDFIDIGFSNFGRAWAITLRTLIKMIVPILGMILSLILLSLAITSSFATIMTGESSGISGVLTIAGLIVYVASIIFAVMVSLLYSLTYYIAYDNPNMTSSEVVERSAQMMRGNRGNLILLELSFIGWAILAVFTLGIGFLWLMPYMQIAVVCFYEKILGKNNDNQIINENVEAIKEN